MLRGPKLNYTFRDAKLLERALSHRSVGRQNNERLEFLGDALLNFVIAQSLFHKFPKAREGDLSRLRSRLVRGSTLAELSLELDLPEHLILGEGELKSGGHRRASIRADAVEAVLGAILCDSDFVTAENIVKTWFASRLENITLDNTDKDPKTRLQEYLQQQQKPLPNYRVLEQTGESHSRQFTVECRLKHRDLAETASGSSKRKAEKSAAKAMLVTLGVDESEGEDTKVDENE